MHFSGKELLKLTEYTNAARQCALVISLMVLVDRFGIKDRQVYNVYNLYTEINKAYSAPWTDSDVKRAYKAFKDVAKTYSSFTVEGDKSTNKGHVDVNRCIRNAANVGLLVMLNIVRHNLGANYKQIDYFLEMFEEFEDMYRCGEQTDIKKLERDLKDIYGIDIFVTKGRRRDGQELSNDTKRIQEKNSKAFVGKG